MKQPKPCNRLCLLYQPTCNSLPLPVPPTCCIYSIKYHLQALNYCRFASPFRMTRWGGGRGGVRSCPAHLRLPCTRVNGPGEPRALTACPKSRLAKGAAKRCRVALPEIISDKMIFKKKTQNCDRTKPVLLFNAARRTEGTYKHSSLVP